LASFSQALENLKTYPPDLLCSGRNSFYGALSELLNYYPGQPAKIAPLNNHTITYIAFTSVNDSTDINNAVPLSRTIALNLTSLVVIPVNSLGDFTNITTVPGGLFPSINSSGDYGAVLYTLNFVNTVCTDPPGTMSPI